MVEIFSNLRKIELCLFAHQEQFLELCTDEKIDGVLINLYFNSDEVQVQYTKIGDLNFIMQKLSPARFMEILDILDCI